MQAKLFCKFGKLSGNEFNISQGATIGKRSANSIVLDSGSISGKHARIFFDDSEKCYYLEDLGSANGTKLDGIRVIQKEKLGKIHAITFAREHKFFFRLLGEIPASKSEAPAPVAEAPPKGTMQDMDAPLVPEFESANLDTMLADEGLSTPAKFGDDKSQTMAGEAISTPQIPMEDSLKSPEPEKPKPKTKVVEEDDIQFPGITGGFKAAEPAAPVESESEFVLAVKSIKKDFQLKSGRNLVGRGEECEICLDHPSISAEHAVLTVKDGKVFMKDLDSKNKTFIKRKELSDIVEVPPNTKVRFGAIEGKIVKA